MMRVNSLHQKEDEHALNSSQLYSNFFSTPSQIKELGVKHVRLFVSLFPLLTTAPAQDSHCLQVDELQNFFFNCAHIVETTD